MQARCWCRRGQAPKRAGPTLQKLLRTRSEPAAAGGDNTTRPLADWGGTQNVQSPATARSPEGWQAQESPPPENSSDQGWGSLGSRPQAQPGWEEHAWETPWSKQYLRGVSRSIPFHIKKDGSWALVEVRSSWKGTKCQGSGDCSYYQHPLQVCLSRTPQISLFCNSLF